MISIKVPSRKSKNTSHITRMIVALTSACLVDASRSCDILCISAAAVLYFFFIALKSTKITYTKRTYLQTALTVKPLKACHCKPHNGVTDVMTN